MTKLEQIAKAMHTYHVQIRIPQMAMPVWVIWRGDVEVETIADAEEAHRRCDKLNARAVVEALGEPTVEMIEAGQIALSQDDLQPTQDEIERAWRAMHAAILK